MGIRIIDGMWFMFRNVPSVSDALGGFYDDLRQRDIIAAGAASGIATAFRAPIGGVIFVLEEAISFFDSKMIFRTYFTTIVAYFTLEILFDGRYLNGRNFTAYQIQVNCTLGYLVEDIVFYGLLGVLGGVVGSFFNTINLRVRALRARYVNSMGWRRLVEAAVIVLITSLIVVLVPLAGQCSAAHKLISHTDGERFNPGSVDVVSDKVCLSDDSLKFFFEEHQAAGNASITPAEASAFLEEIGLSRLQCKEGEYNELASLFYSTGHMTVTHLFRTGSYALFDAHTLAIFVALYFFLAAITAGMSVPSGLVIPMLTIGGGLGRLFALGLNRAVKSPLGLHEVDPGAWAMVGAAAFWAGSGGVTVTVAIIILEITGDFQRLPPIAVAVIVAKLVGEAINHGLYHSLIHLQHIPFLSDVPEEDMNNVIVEDVMSKPVVTFGPADTLQRVNDVLQSTTHNGFPVIGQHLGRTIVKGLVLRENLLTVLPPGHAPAHTNVRGGVGSRTTGCKMDDGWHLANTFVAHGLWRP
jgi:chloride channel 7